MTSQSIANIRLAVFGSTGIACVIYALVFLLTGGSAGLPFWVPGVMGIGAALVLVLSSAVADPAASEGAWDESYRYDSRLAASIGFWVGLFCFPVLGLASFWGAMAIGSAYAVTSLSMGASYLLAQVYFDLRGRA